MHQFNETKVVIFTEKDKLQSYLTQFFDQKQKIGLVPTMGALHEGHLSLVKKAWDENDIVVVSIFVNPTQFNNANDLKKYPRTLEKDTALLNSLDAKIVIYAPSAMDIYDNKITSETFAFDGLEHQMEGKFRSGHFDGVGTIVKKLLTIVKPHRAYFGEKDFQQLQIIKKLVEKHLIPTTIVPCAISREENGLARSSRNSRLTASEKEEASFIYKTLKTAKQKFGTNSATTIKEWVVQQFKNHSLLELEYIEIAEETTLQSVKRKQDHKKYRAFIAVYINGVRLIDNIALN